MNCFIMGFTGIRTVESKSNNTKQCLMVNE